MDSSGNLQQQVSIDFSNDTMSANGGPATAFAPANFLTSLNTALGGAGTASFTNGALSLSATAAGQGIAIQDDPTTPAQDGGQGFSQFFGLNDLISSNEITNFNTGLQLSDNNGFTPGGQIVLQIANSSGTPLSQETVTVPAAGSPSMQDLLNSLNSTTSGVGQYGAFGLNSDGALSFTPNTPGGASISVVTDTTQRGAGGRQSARSSARRGATRQHRHGLLNPARHRGQSDEYGAGHAQPARCGQRSVGPRGRRRLRARRCCPTLRAPK